MKKNKNEQLNTIPRPLRERKQLYERSELQMQVWGYKQFKQDEPRPLNTTTRDLVKCSTPARKGWGQLAAFTLAEVLITLGIIGVVAALTIPTLVANYQERVKKEQVRITKYKITQATSLMNSSGGLTQAYPTTEAFINELQKYLKIAKVCDNSKLEECWPSEEIEVPTSSGAYTTMSIKNIKTGSDLKALGLGTKNTQTMGIVTGDGATMILTYSPQCTPLDQYTNYNYSFEDNKPVTNATTNCISAIFDVNGSKGPNRVGDDVRTWNSVFGAVKLSRGAATKEECLQLKKKGLVQYCELDNDYWAGAVKKCNDIGLSIPSEQTILSIAGSMFGVSNIPTNTAVIYKNTWGMSSCNSVLSGMGYPASMITGLNVMCLSGSRSGLANKINSSITTKLSSDTWTTKEFSATQALEIEFAGSPDILMPVINSRTYASGDTLCVAD